MTRQGHTQADATIHAIDKIAETQDNSDLQERVSQLEDKIKELEERNQELESHIQELGEDPELEELKEEIEETVEEIEEETEDTNEPFFKDIKPTETSMKVRKNAIRDWFQEVRENEGKFADRDVYEVCESVFGYTPSSASHRQYMAVYNAIHEMAEMVSTNNTGRNGTQKFRLSEKVKV